MPQDLLLCSHIFMVFISFISPLYLSADHQTWLSLWFPVAIFYFSHLDFIKTSDTNQCLDQQMLLPTDTVSLWMSLLQGSGGRRGGEALRPVTQGQDMAEFGITKNRRRWRKKTKRIPEDDATDWPVVWKRFIAKSCCLQANVGPPIRGHWHMTSPGLKEGWSCLKVRGVGGVDCGWGLCVCGT